MAPNKGSKTAAPNKTRSGRQSKVSKTKSSFETLSDKNDTTAPDLEAVTTTKKRGRPHKVPACNPTIAIEEPLLQQPVIDPVACSSVSISAVDQLQQERDASVQKQNELHQENSSVLKRNQIQQGSDAPGLLVPLTQSAPDIVETLRRERALNCDLKKKLQQSQDDFDKFKEESNSKISALENKLETLLGQVNFFYISLLYILHLYFFT